MFKEFLRVFSQPNPTLAAKQELLEARMALLEARSGFEYAAAMVDYHGRRVARLQAELSEEGATNG